MSSIVSCTIVYRVGQSFNMSRGKTDWGMLRELGNDLELYCQKNGFDVKRCSKYQWNVQEHVQNILLAIYPGSGLAYAQRLHYTHTGLIDSTSKKYRFTNKDTMKKVLDSIFFAVDSI
jgi:hypothetical protein